MQLQTLQLTHFKNYASGSLTFHERLICITGLNGAGKTNLLDAIHYLSTGKSSVNSVDSQNIRHSSDHFVVEGSFEVGDDTHTVFCGLMKGQAKRLKLDGKDYERKVLHYGKFPCVMVSPPDIVLVTEGNDERRKFVDSTISLYDDFYLDCLLQYNQIMAQRNAHLKKFQETKQVNEKLLDVYDKQLNYFGSELHKERQSFEKEFAPLFAELVTAINAEKEMLTLRYVSTLHEGPLLAQLQKGRDRDKALGRTDVGPHKDQWVFEINGLPLKKYGSQGQQKSHLLALKLAKAALVTAKTKKDPILLLDDVFDRLDHQRVQNLMKLVNGRFGQVFITDTSQERLREILNLCGLDGQFLQVKDGTVSTA